MKKRYIVCINKSTEEQKESFLEYIKEKNYSWWHYLDNTWLIVDKSGKSEARDIRDVLKEVFSKEYNMVFELAAGQGTWSGFGPNSEDRNMFDWIHRNWY